MACSIGFETVHLWLDPSFPCKIRDSRAWRWGDTLPRNLGEFWAHAEGHGWAADVELFFAHRNLSMNRCTPTISKVESSSCNGPLRGPHHFWTHGLRDTLMTSVFQRSCWYVREAHAGRRIFFCNRGSPALFCSESNELGFAPIHWSTCFVFIGKQKGIEVVSDLF